MKRSYTDVLRPAAVASNHARHGQLTPRSLARRSPGIRLAAVVSLCVIAVTLTLSACGGGSSSSTSSTAADAAASLGGAAGSPSTPSASATTKSETSTGAGASASGSAGSSAVARTRFNQALSNFAACLKSNGVKLPPAKSGKVLSLKGVDTKSTEYRKALAMCRPVLSAALKAAAKERPTPASPSRATTAPRAPNATTGASPAAPARTPAKVPTAVTAVLKRFTACMRGSGIAAFPEPEGARFNVQRAGIDTSTEQYKEAEKHCTGILQAVDPYRPKA